MAVKKRAKKPQEIVPLMLRLREDLRSRLAKDAEKAAKSLNAEITGRLEESYSSADKLGLLRESSEKRIEELKRIAEDARSTFETDAKRLRSEYEKLRTELIEKTKKDFQHIKDKAELHNVSGEIIDALIGDDAASKEAVRSVALLFASNAGWASDSQNVLKITKAVVTAIRAAASKGAQQ